MARSTIFKPDVDQLPPSTSAPRSAVAELDPGVEVSLRTARAIEKNASGQPLTTAEDEHLRTSWARTRMDGPSADARRERVDYARWLRGESAKKTTIAAFQAQAGSGEDRRAAAAKLAQAIDRQAEELPTIEARIRELDALRAGLARDVAIAQAAVASRDAAVAGLKAERLLPADILEELKELRRSLREPVQVAGQLRSRLACIEALSAYDPGRDKAAIEAYACGELRDLIFPLPDRKYTPMTSNMRRFDPAAWAAHIAELQTEAETLREQLSTIPDPANMIAEREAALLSFWVPE